MLLYPLTNQNIFCQIPQTLCHQHLDLWQPVQTILTSEPGIYNKKDSYTIHVYRIKTTTWIVFALINKTFKYLKTVNVSIWCGCEDGSHFLCWHTTKSDSLDESYIIQNHGMYTIFYLFLWLFLLLFILEWMYLSKNWNWFNLSSRSYALVHHFP